MPLHGAEVMELAVAGLDSRRSAAAIRSAAPLWGSKTDGGGRQRLHRERRRHEHRGGQDRTHEVDGMSGRSPDFDAVIARVQPEFAVIHVEIAAYGARAADPPG